MRKRGGSSERTTDLRNRNTVDHYGFGFPTGKKAERKCRNISNIQKRDAMNN